MKITSIYKSFESDLILEIDTINNGKFQFSKYHQTLHFGRYSKTDNIITDPNVLRNFKNALNEFIMEKTSEITNAEEILNTI